MGGLKSRLANDLRTVRNTPPRIWIAVIKGTLAYMILVILGLSTKVRSGFNYPIVLTSATVVVVAGFPGSNYGQCLGATIFGLIGVGLGAVAFVILAKLANAPVAQGIVFVIIVYLFSLLKARSMKFFGTALLGILVSFAGIYTSLYIPGKRFVPEYLEDYLKAYTLGGAIVLVVNFLILPISSEKELRRTLVTSLGHVRTFSHLIAKSYSGTITEEEKAVRDGLAQSIRADFGILQQKLGSTTLQINFSKFSMEDYQKMISWTNRLQQDLIGTYSTITASEEAWRRSDQTLFRKEFLPSTQQSFLVLRKEISHCIREICRVLGDGIRVEELREYEEYRDTDNPEQTAENGQSDPARGRANSAGGMGATYSPRGLRHEDLVKRALDGGLRRRLDTEIGVVPTPVHGRSPANSRRPSLENAQRPTPPLPSGPESSDGEPAAAGAGTSESATDVDSQSRTQATSGPPSTAFAPMSATVTKVTSRSASPLLMGHYKFRDSQQEVLSQLLCSGQMHAADDVLRLDSKQPALTERFTAKAEREMKEGIEIKNRKKGRIPKTGITDAEQKYEADQEKAKATDMNDPDRSQGRLLLAVTSFMFLMGQFTRDLDDLHKYVVGEIGVRKRKRLHVHVFEASKGGKQPTQAFSGRPTAPYVSGPGLTSNLTTQTDDNDNDDEEEAVQSGGGTGNGKLNGQTGKKAKKQHDHHHHHQRAPPMPMYEALAVLEGRTPVYPKPKNFVQRIVELEQVVRSDASLNALKTAAAAIAYTSLILAPSSRAFFIEYSLTGGVLSVVVAMSPTLGQTLFTFLNQVIGTVAGNVYGMVLLYIFRDVGGYKYNPYGIACMLLPFALVMSYLLYTKPPFFPLGLLALNGANLVIFTEVIYGELPTWHDTPALRMGKALVAMCIGLAIAFAFQFMVLRAPARRLLRQATAELMSHITAYYILHAAYIAAIGPEAESVNGVRAPINVVNEVSHELARRERAIQGQLIELYPLINFAKLEPDFAGEFRQDLYRKIIGSAQLFMDRLREARVIVTTFDDNDMSSDAHQELSVFWGIPTFMPMASYRRMHNRLTKHRLYMLTTALQSKTPLPQDSLSTRFVPTGIIQHDILVLAQRLIKEEGGTEVVRSGSFLRLLSYMLAVGNWRIHIDALEEAVGDLLGVWEDDEFL